MKIAEDRHATYNVAQLASLFTVCALAIESVDAYADDIRNRALMDVQHVLEWGSVLAGKIAGQVERELDEAKDGRREPEVAS